MSAGVQHTTTMLAAQDETQRLTSSGSDSSCEMCQCCCQATHPKLVLATLNNCNAYATSQNRQRQTSLTSNDSGIVTAPSLDTIQENINQENRPNGGTNIYETRISSYKDENIANQNTNNTKRNCIAHKNLDHSIFQMNNREARLEQALNSRDSHVMDSPLQNGNIINRNVLSDNMHPGVQGSLRNPLIFTPSDEANGDRFTEKLNSKLNWYRMKKCRVYSVYLLFLLLIIATNVYVFHNKQQMENEIASLKQALSERQGTASPHVALAEIPPAISGSNRPYIHLSLKSERHVPHAAWGQRVLQWNTVTSPSERGVSGNQLEYDSNKRCLVVREAGTYFVYNQIYVYRHVKDGNQIETRSVSNQTLFHAILKRPFNFPSNKKPIIISESTLSNCWHEKANTQIHSSYQGIIVDLQASDEILISLQDYNDSIDTLDPKSTSFGAFKL